ncbi:PhzF family phenazine biosynthesis protein [Streptacidiphilus albus]|uniref:PhzF family phenazine biosynthesis protein n=1 Tax=Streptacidiphilus albus TaxID=105425 RepID=UPI00054BBA29|nr:PhzF family phenazine biosynthesis protein [Streptacidiphilus albus]
MTDLHVLRVFCGPDGGAGNLLGVVRDGAAVAAAQDRQAVAAALGFSETVFVDDAAEGRVDIYTPSIRLLFAGHPLVGTGWLLRQEGLAVETLRPAAGEVPFRQDEEFSWIRARAEWAAGRRTHRYGSAAEVDALPAPPEGTGWLYAWAWADEAEARVRARAFPRRGDGIVEDEATGAAALVLTQELARGLDIRQGVGSQLVTRPQSDGTIEVGGRVALDSVRPL